MLKRIACIFLLVTPLYAARPAKPVPKPAPVPAK